MKDQIMISKLHLGAQINVQSQYVIQLFHIHFLNKKQQNLKLILIVLPFKYDT